MATTTTTIASPPTETPIQVRNETVNSVVIKSSLVLQILIVVQPYYFAFFWLCTLAMLVYKGFSNDLLIQGLVFQYSSYVYGIEVAALFPFIALESSRLFLGSRGNKMEESGPTFIFMGLSLLSSIVYCYYLYLQTYV
jgi:transmembrane protein 216